VHIDVHAHVYPTEYLNLLERLGSTETAVARGMGADLTDAEIARRLELMDAAGVDMQLLSASPQLPHFGDAGSAADAARLIDDLYAGLVAAHSDRFRRARCRTRSPTSTPPSRRPPARLTSLDSPASR
jgi:hypothetical protein